MIEPGRPFDFVARLLEDESRFNRLQARGTVRLVLKRLGLGADASDEEMAIVVRHGDFKGALRSRGVSEEEVGPIVDRLSKELARTVFTVRPKHPDSIENVFSRLWAE